MNTIPLGQEPPAITPETTTPATLHAKARAFLNSPSGQLQNMMTAMHAHADNGQFQMNAKGLSGFTISNLKTMGHDVQQNVDGSHTVNWQNAKN